MSLHLLTRYGLPRDITPAPDDQVEVVDSTVESYVTGTSVSRTIPSATQEGDWVIAMMFHRSSINSSPSGFTRIASVMNADPPDNFGQVTEVWLKVADANDADEVVSFGQSASGRMALALIVLRGAGRLRVEDAAATDYGATSTTPGEHPVPVVTSGGSGRLALSISSCVYAETSGTTTYTPPEGWTGTTSADVADNRLSVAHKSVNAGDTSAELTHEHAVTTHSGGEIVLMVAAGDDPHEYEVFTADDTWNWANAGEPDQVDVLLVGGGGAGCNGPAGNMIAGGGGGAGGVRVATAIAVNGDVTVTVGDGAPETPSGSTGSGADGGPSSFGDESVLGGGGGGINDTTRIASSGGSGGGSSSFGTAGSGTTGQGHGGGVGTTNIDGSRSGGGGGKDTAGVDGGIQVGGHGGAGVTLGSLGFADAITRGAPLTVGGGGGGGAYRSTGGTHSGGDGGFGGGGDGGTGAVIPTGGTAGATNTGGGGGGGGTNDSSGGATVGGAGGSGLVIVRWIRP